jgi:hypothetical protein
MVYLVEIQTPIAGKKRFEIITKGFACTSQEFLREVATYCKCQPVQISDIGQYDSAETAKIIIESRRA